MIIAVDGPAASGKGTLARRLAQHFGLAYLDTGGALSRHGLAGSCGGGDPADPGVAASGRAARSGSRISNDPRLREERVGEAASVVAAIPAVRAALLGFQRDFARHPPSGATGAVLDGRDIGTVVCPEADGQALRHRRARGPGGAPIRGVAGRRRGAIYGRVLQDMKVRDARDSGRGRRPWSGPPTRSSSTRPRSMPMPLSPRQSTSSPGSLPAGPARELIPALLEPALAEKTSGLPPRPRLSAAARCRFVPGGATGSSRGRSGEWMAVATKPHRARQGELRRAAR